MGALWRGQFEGNPYLGLFVRACDSVALIPRPAQEKFEFGAKALGAAKLVHASVDGSPLLGLFCAMNSQGALVPRNMRDDERKELEDAGVEVHVMADLRFSAIGNNVACNDSGALINPDIPRREAAEIAEMLGVDFEQHALAGYKCAGMACVATNRGWAAHNRITEDEASMLESLFKVRGGNATVNSGTALVGVGVCATSHGALIGEKSSGFEVARISQALDLA